MARICRRRYVADAGYCSEKNVEAGEALGITPSLPWPGKITIRTGGSGMPSLKHWLKMPP